MVFDTLFPSQTNRGRQVIYVCGSDKSGICFFFLLNGTAQLKTGDFVEVKKISRDTHWQSTYSIKNKTTVSCDDSLDPGPEARAGLHLGVPGKEQHHLLHLLDQITGFAARLYIDPLFKYATYKIVKRVAVRQAGKPDLLHPHLPKVLFEPVLHPLAVLVRAAVLLEDVMGISSYLSTSFDTIFTYLPCSCW
jgi:hypothetical protein